MLTCSSATAMQCSVKLVSELFLGRQLISFDKSFLFEKNRIVLHMQDKLCWHEQEKFAHMQDNYLSSTYRFNLRIIETDFFFFLQNVCSNSKRKGGVGIIISFLYNILNYNTYMSIVCNCVRSFICFPWFVIFALIDNINATCTSV